MVSIAEFADNCDCDIDLQCLLGESQALATRIKKKYKSIREEIQTKQAEKPIGVQL